MAKKKINIFDELKSRTNISTKRKKNISILFTEDEIEKLDTIANNLGVSKSVVVKETLALSGIFKNEDENLINK